MEYKERIREIMKALKVNQVGLASKLGVSQGIISEFASGAREPSKEFILGIYKLGISIDWFFSGNGEMFLAKSLVSQQDIVNSGVVGMAINNANGSVENFGNFNMITDPLQVNPKGLPLYTIPLLTKEQALRFDPIKEIPSPEAYSGRYPDYTLVPIPRRLQEYGTDLRAIVVFNGLMVPLLNPGDVAIFQATGWNGDGVYVYRMSGDLHISHTKSCRQDFQLTKEFKPDEEISYDAGSFEIIGRIRAVVREIG